MSGLEHQQIYNFFSFMPLIFAFILDTHTCLFLATYIFESEVDSYLHIKDSILLFTFILGMLVCLTFFRTWCWGNHTFTHFRSHYLQVLEGINGFIKNSKEFLRSKLPGFWVLRWFFYILEEGKKKKKDKIRFFK